MTQCKSKRNTPGQEWNKYSNMRLIKIFLDKKSLKCSSENIVWKQWWSKKQKTLKV